jgi:hypothetical protein
MTAGDYLPREGGEELTPCPRNPYSTGGQNKNLNDTRACGDGVDFRAFFCPKVDRGEKAKKHCRIGLWRDLAKKGPFSEKAKKHCRIGLFRPSAIFPSCDQMLDEKGHNLLGNLPRRPQCFQAGGWFREYLPMKLTTSLRYIDYAREYVCSCLHVRSRMWLVRS